jgi:predicted ATP-dependent endonuclease of OLD family
LVPTIAYFPTFVFNFPEKIFLTDRGDRVDRFFAQVFQDILDYEGSGFDVAKDIVARVRAEDKKTSWVDFFSLWTSQDHRDKIQHIMDRAGSAVTKLVFGSWNDIFGEAAIGKSVEIIFEAAEGEKKDASGNLVKTKEHDIWIKFQVRDGTRRFSVNDRSLGFRWFFAFMLFTQFRVARASGHPILFLFDEPAANLHASAQQKLLESFPKIARGDHCLIYTTHSHYLIDPNWLEQTYIVTNRGDTPSQGLLSDTSLDDESLDIKAETYRSFVAKNPNQTSYFQPILDRINFLPSRFDMDRRSLIVEGKSDYYIISYAAKLLNFNQYAIVPALGAGTISPLVSLHLGWGLDFFFLLDFDEKGREQRERHIKEFAISPNRVLMLGDLVVGATDIESIVDSDTKTEIRSQLGLSKDPDKTALRRFFQERLAAARVEKLSDKFEENFRSLFAKLIVAHVEQR